MLRRGPRAIAFAAVCLLCVLHAAPLSALLGEEFTIDKEMEMTAGIHRQIRAQAPFVNDPIVLAYVNEIGQRIVQTTEPQPFVYRFSIVEDDNLNAFTIGGGYVYLHSEVVAQSANVSELAGVLAHEIAHVRMRHIAKRQENQGLSTLTSLAALAVLLAGGDANLAVAAQGINVALQLENSRDNEAEADREGIAYMVKAGYDPDGMSHFFGRILTAHPHAGDGVPPYLFSHPALKDRIAGSKVTIKHTDLPTDLVEEDERLPEIQTRLALTTQSVAGGSGLLARPEFDRSVSDPYMERAEKAEERGELDKADKILAEAQKAQPNDPRLALARADLAEKRGDLEAARRHLERAFELDSNVPLTAYQLGRVNRQLGNRTTAVFYLEQAATSFRPGSSSRRRAELEIEQLTFSALDRSGLGNEGGHEADRNFYVRGEHLVWWGKLSKRIQSYNPKLRVLWTGPDGEVVFEQTVRMRPLGGLQSDFETRRQPLGRYLIRVFLGDSVIEEREFHLIDPPKSG